jgi:hypothetical protein
MIWKFWKKEENDETTIKVTKFHLGTEIYVNAQSSKKALDLYNKIKEKVS